MPKLPRRFIENYTTGVNRVSQVNRKMLAAELATVDYSNMTSAANEVVGIMERHCELAANESARLASTYYRGVSAFQTGEDFDAQPYTGRKAVATEKATRGIIQLGVDGNFEDMFVQLTDRLDYEVKKAAGVTVMQNARRDRRHPRFARVPAGAETCNFCLMLASRGPVYWTAETAGAMNHYHANCDCRIVPVWDSVAIVTERGGVIRRGGSQIEGYDPDAYFERYLEMTRNGVRFPSQNRWHTMRDYPSGETSNQRERLQTMRNRSVRYLADADDYTEFMERVAQVEATWNSMEISEEVRRQWRLLNEQARAIRKRLMEQQQ